MISRYAWYLRETLKKVWVRVVGLAIFALVAAIFARYLSPFLPQSVVLETGSDAVSELLRILTSSMLAVTTFSLSIAVSAFAAASGSATPRATVLLQEDRTTQNVLATFLGAFLFGLVGLIALRAQLYDASGKVIIFLFTIVVIGLVVVALIGWIGHLMQFGRMADTLSRVEVAASEALMQRFENPFLGGVPLQSDIPDDAHPITAKEAGYVQHVDMQALQDCAQTADGQLFLQSLPGSFVAPGTVLACIDAPELSETQIAEIEKGFTIGAARSFNEDPRFGLIVMTEIASRALSPAVNDPGTAIDIIGRHVRLLAPWRMRKDATVQFDRVQMPPIAPRDAIEDAFRPIARDGAALVEVQIRLQKALATLCAIAPDVFGPACMAMSQEAIERARAVPLMPAEIDAIRAAASQMFAGYLEEA